MTRTVECVLVGTGDKASSDAIEVMKDFARTRFKISPVVLQASQATKDNVMAAVTGAAGRCKPGGLFVLMFSGHGGFTPAANYWQLIDDQLRDDELLRLLAHFDLDVEIAVVSDCCYGAGMLHAGVGTRMLTPRGGERLDLGMSQRMLLEGQLSDRWRAFARAATTETAEHAARAFPRALDQRSIVMISATDWLMIRSTVQNQFIRALCEGVNLAKKYGELREKMISVIKPEGQSNWNVQAEPAKALELPPLSP